MKQDLLDLLYRSLDEDLAPSERKVLEEALAASEDLRQERDRLIAMRAAIADSTVDSFKPFFAERVMRRLADAHQGAQAGQFWPGWVAILRQVALAGAIAIVALVAINLVKSDAISATTALGLPDVPLEQIIQPPVETILEELS